MPVEQVHLHEVGAIDSIIDIVGAVHGLEWVGASHVTSSALNVGSGTVQCAHGTFPVPAPATARLLKGVPIYAGEVAKELVTPTGALIVTSYASSYGALPAMRVESIGYGAGSRDFDAHPNVLRMFLGESIHAEQAETIVRIECEIDDMNPQLFGPLMDRLSAAGALDVFYAPVQMKKNRPGTLVTAIAPPDRREAIVSVLFNETTTIGVRYDEMLRDRLDREIRTIETPVGTIRFKVAGRAGRILNAAPEFDDCARIAAERGMSIKDVQAIATKAWLDAKQ
jgi:pyridinium-3,5-bisthiocarboxylic acid mononucleotide nickel chelatase